MSTNLVIPDLHSWFIVKNFYKFVNMVYEGKHPKLPGLKCDRVTFIGDIFDYHVISRHQTHPDADGAKEEYLKALKEMQPFYKRWPTAKVCIGNHDARLYRQSAEGKIPSILVKNYHEWSQCPKTWDWQLEHEIDGVRYMHGTAAKYSGKGPHVTAAKTLGQSAIIGHYHCDFGVNFMASDNQLIFGAIAGCGMDSSSYAAHYAAERLVKPIVGCLVVIDGEIVIPIPMNRGAKIKHLRG